MSYINPLQDTSGNLSFSSNSTSILDKSLYYNFWNDINQKPSFCNIAFSADYIDISNKPNLNPLSTSSNLYYSSNSYHSSFSNLNYSISNSLINFTDNKLNNLNSSLWGTIGNHIYSNLGSVGIGTSSLGNNKLVIKGNLKSDDLKIKGMGFSNLLITSNILDNKSNLLYTSISNQDYLSKNKQITSSQFTTDINNNLYIINSNIGIGTSSNLINDMILINGNTNIHDFKIKRTSSSNLLITSNILDNSSNYLIEIFNSNFNKYSSSIWSNSINSSIYITSNLGIGSTIPNQILDIYGNIRISGSILPNSCNSFDLGSLNKKWKDLYISGNSIYLNDFIIRNSNNYLNISNIDVSSINFLNNLNTNSNIISLNTNGDFMIGNKYLLGINGNSSNIIFSNVLSNSSNSLINLNNSKFNSSNSTDLIKIANKRFITNDIYNRPATFSGILESYNLTTSNLNVIGDYTIFNTTIYQTEQLFIENSCNYPAMIIKQMNINKNVAEFYNSNLIPINISITGTGNSINITSDNSNYNYAIFTSNGTFSTDNNIICDILIVGGGGGGGKSDLTDGNNGRYGGGGGGSGDVIYIQNYNLNKGSYSINIGSGGSGGTGTNNSGNGTNTTIIFNSSTLIGAGGGGGGADAQTNSGKSGTIISSLWGTSSGGGGGGGGNLGNGGNGNTYSGNGANGKNSGEQVSQGGGGGGGPVVNAIEINGGLGLTINIIGTNIVYGGGAGGQRNYSWVPGSAGGTGYGSGGGTSQNGNGGSGKTGVVIIRYAIKNPDIQMKFLVNSNGNIGIGTNIPVSKLDVIGSINSKGLVVNNNEIINQIKTNDSNYSNSLFYSWNYSNNLFLSLSNSIENIKNSKQDLLNSSTILLGNGANITNVNYNNLINKPDLSIYSTSVNSTSNSLFINVSNIDYYSSNSNISYVNNGTDNLIKFLWNTNGNNVFTNSNIGIGSFIPSSPLDINGNFNTNELLIKKGNLSNFFITSNIFDNRSNNYYSSLSNLDYNSSNSNVNYVNNIVNTAINNYNSYLNSIDLWKTGVNNGVYINSNINILDNLNNFTNLNTNIIITSNLGSITNSITSTCNSLVLSGNSLARFNYTNDININSGTYDISINGGISIGESPFVRPWGAYFANDWSGNTLLDSSGNGRHATTSGTITKSSGSDNGASGSITYISGGTSATITWPSGSVPTNFTILSLTRYTGGSRKRILRSMTGNWLHGHWGYDGTGAGRGMCFYEGWKTNQTSKGNLDDWLCCIGKNGGTIPNNILVDGTGIGTSTGGVGNLQLVINTGTGSAGEESDWVLSVVIIYDSHLSDAHMVKLNNLINTYKTNADLTQLKNAIIGVNDNNSYPILRNGNGTIINPTLWYKFDDNSNLGLDSSGNEFHLINYGAIFDNINKIRGNGSVKFNASLNQYTTITNSIPFRTIQTTNGLTISIWIKLNNTNLISYQRIFHFSNSAQSSLFVICRYSISNDLYFGLWDETPDFITNNSYNYFNDSWYNIIWTISTTGVWTIYVNGINLNISKTRNFSSTLNYNDIQRIGNGLPIFYEYLNGNIDDFRIYNFVLTSNQIQELYNGRIDIYNYIPVNNYSSNLLIKGDMNITGNLKLNNNLLKLIETPNISITGTGNSINNVINDSNYRYALFNSNGTFSVNNNIICDILVVGGGGSGGTRAGGGGGAGSLIYKTNQILNSGFYSVTIGNGGAGQPYSTTTSYIGNDGGDTLINFNGINIYIAKGGGGGAYNLSSLGRIGGSCGGNSTEQPQTPLAIPYNIQNEPDGIYGNQGGGGGLTGNDGYAGGGGGGAGSVGGTITTTNAGNGGSGLNINITGVSNLYAGGGGGGAGRYNSVIAGTGGSGIGGVGGTLSTTPGENGLANTGSGGGGSGFGTLTNEWDNNGASGSGGSGVVIIRYSINQPVFSGAVNYSNIRNRPYLLDLLTSSNIINVGEENNINFPLSITSWKNEWFLFIGTSPTNIPNSFIFHHITPTINSKWWFNGTTSTTKAEISDERIKKEINDLSNGLHKLMLLNPKEYFLCDDKDYHKKYGIIAQDVSQIPELSHLVHKDTDFIANIYSSGSYDNSNGMFIITSSKKIDGLIEINDELKILLDNKENPEIIIEELPYDNRYKKRFLKVKNIINDFSFEIFDDIELNEFDKSNLFIYGKKINDFLKLDYNSLYTLNIKANQEIYDIINNSYNTLNNLTTRIKILEDKLS